MSNPYFIKQVNKLKPYIVESYIGDNCHIYTLDYYKNWIHITCYNNAIEILNCSGQLSKLLLLYMDFPQDILEKIQEIFITHKHISHIRITTKNIRV